MKRIFSFAIAAAMLLSITACGNGSSADGQGGTQGSGGQAQGNILHQCGRLPVLPNHLLLPVGSGRKLRPDVPPDLQHGGRLF